MAKAVEIVDGAKKMELFVMERYVILQMRPPRASFAEQAMADEVAKKIMVTEEEQKRAGQQSGPGTLSWTSDFVTEYSFTTPEMDYLKNRVTTLDAERAITPNMVSVIRKIRG
jgi:hypothetical protein